MNTVHYFVTHNRWVAVAPGQFEEIVTFCHFEGDAHVLFASIDLHTGSIIQPEWYERIENGYSVSSYEEYTEARRKAQAATGKYLGDIIRVTMPPARPEYVERAGELVLNDLPF